MSAAVAFAPARNEAPQLEASYNLQTSTGLALVVDDSPDIANMLAAVLRHAGYDVTTAYSAQDALTAAFARHFDLVVSDIGMPGMNGYELARALEAGFDDHLSKPIDPGTLRRAVLGIREH